MEVSRKGSDVTIRLSLTEEVNGRVYQDEQEFKMFFIKTLQNNIRAEGRTSNIFCIETESTVKGFPDVLVDIQGTQAIYFEFKISTAKEEIKFEKTQPPFYKRNKDMQIYVVAYNITKQRAVVFKALDIFLEDSPFKIDLATRKVKISA